MEKPTAVLCKRTLTIGEPFYYKEGDDVKIPRDNRMLVKGNWYLVVDNEHDGNNTFSIIDNQGSVHLHYMYTDEDRKSWPTTKLWRDGYGPRDYSKWFYTPEELEKRVLRQMGMSHLTKLPKYGQNRNQTGLIQSG